MSEQMTEAAMLYWENLDVLTPACHEMTAYLDATSDHWWNRVEKKWQDQHGSADELIVKRWTHREDPGRWSVYLENSKTGLEVHVSKTGLHVQVSDPRRSGEVNHYQLILINTEQHRKELAKIGEQAFDTLTQLASESDIALRPSGEPVLAEENLDFLTDSASELGDLVADTILNQLRFIAKFDTWWKNLKEPTD